MERTEIVGTKVEKTGSNLKIVTAFQLDNQSNLFRNQGDIYFTEDEALIEANKIAIKKNTKVIINKVQVLENGSFNQVAVISPEEKNHYGDEELFFFFGVNESNLKRY
ncbi:hypothetical protein LG296_21140 (plasmid) [Ureibacillus chungkukjangi]|uniref:hypothetical protein n=1 Tax=Ureibacillus chungkukjangi TaxID=1202712 RepID=UPI000D390E0F|nr:hypothetical protein [Ureibacillus chungkukjangi]MCM3390194.1 hypothetical protein [Ureibacillus chungkukjangi]